MPIIEAFVQALAEGSRAALRKKLIQQAAERASLSKSIESGGMALTEQPPTVLRQGLAQEQESFLSRGYKDLYHPPAGFTYSPITGTPGGTVKQFVKEGKPLSSIQETPLSNAQGVLQRELPYVTVQPPGRKIRDRVGEFVANLGGEPGAQEKALLGIEEGAKEVAPVPTTTGTIPSTAPTVPVPTPVVRDQRSKLWTDPIFKNLVQSVKGVHRDKVPTTPEAIKDQFSVYSKMFDEAPEQLAAAQPRIFKYMEGLKRAGKLAVVGALGVGADEIINENEAQAMPLGKWMKWAELPADLAPKLSVSGTSSSLVGKTIPSVWTIPGSPGTPRPITSILKGEGAQRYLVHGEDVLPLTADMLASFMRNQGSAEYAGKFATKDFTGQVEQVKNALKRGWTLSEGGTGKTPQEKLSFALQHDTNLSDLGQAKHGTEVVEWNGRKIPVLKEYAEFFKKNKKAFEIAGVVGALGAAEELRQPDEAQAARWGQMHEALKSVIKVGEVVKPEMSEPFVKLTTQNFSSAMRVNPTQMGDMGRVQHVLEIPVGEKLIIPKDVREYFMTKTSPEVGQVPDKEHFGDLLPKFMYDVKDDQLRLQVSSAYDMPGRNKPFENPHHPALIGDKADSFASGDENLLGYYGRFIRGWYDPHADQFLISGKFAKDDIARIAQADPLKGERAMKQLDRATGTALRVLPNAKIVAGVAGAVGLGTAATSEASSTTNTIPTTEGEVPSPTREVSPPLSLEAGAASPPLLNPAQLSLGVDQIPINEPQSTDLSGEQFPMPTGEQAQMITDAMKTTPINIVQGFGKFMGKLSWDTTAPMILQQPLEKILSEGGSLTDMPKEMRAFMSEHPALTGIDMLYMAGMLPVGLRKPFFTLGEKLGGAVWNAGGKQLAKIFMPKTFLEKFSESPARWLGQRFTNYPGLNTGLKDLFKRKNADVGEGLEQADKLAMTAAKGLSYPEQSLMMEYLTKGWYPMRAAKPGEMPWTATQIFKEAQQAGIEPKRAMEVYKRSKNIEKAFTELAQKDGSRIADQIYTQNLSGFAGHIPFDKSVSDIIESGSHIFEKLTFGQRLNLAEFFSKKNLPADVYDHLAMVLEPAQASSRGYADLMKRVVGNKLFNQLRDTQSSVDRTGVFTTRIPQSAKYGSMGGRYTTPAIAWQVEALDSQTMQAAKHFISIGDKLLSPWKYSKVILSPAASARDSITALLMNHLGGLGAHRLDIYAGATKDLLFQRGTYKKLESEGELYRLLGSTWLGREIYSNLGPITGRSMMGWVANKGIPLALKAGGATVGGKIGYESGDSPETRMMGAVGGAAAGGLFAANAAKLRLAEEQMFKLAKFKFNNEVLKMSTKDAVDDALKFGFDYSEIPVGVRGVRASLMPFATWTYKALPVIAEAAVKHPLRLGSIFMGLYMAQQEAVKRLGIQPKEWDDLQNTLPDRMKGGGIAPNMLLPTRDEKGRLQFVDLTYILPWGDVAEFQNQGWSRVLQHPLLSIAPDFRDNKTALGTKIWNTYDDPTVKFAKASKHAMLQLLPSLTPGIGYNYTLIDKATRNEEGYEGPTRRQALLSTLAGIKVRPVDPAVSKQRYGNKIKGMLSEAKQELNKRIQVEGTPKEQAVEEYKTDLDMIKRNFIEKLQQ